jgi:hypothetical protein
MQKLTKRLRDVSALEQVLGQRIQKLVGRELRANLAPIPAPIAGRRGDHAAESADRPILRRSRSGDIRHIPGIGPPGHRR